MEPSMSSRRLGAVRITGELIQEMFLVGSQKDHWFQVEQGIPADAKFIYMAIDDSLGHSDLVLVYEHESFPLHKPGDPVWTCSPPSLRSVVVTVEEVEAAHRARLAHARLASATSCPRFRDFDGTVHDLWTAASNGVEHGGRMERPDDPAPDATVQG